MSGGNGRAALGFQRKRKAGTCAWPAASVTRLWIRSWLYSAIHSACSPVAISGTCALGISLRAVRKKRSIFPLILGVLGQDIVHGQVNHRTDATKLTAGKLTAAGTECAGARSRCRAPG